MTDLELLQAQLSRLRSEFDDAFSRAPTSREQGLQRFVALRCGGTKHAVALSDISLLQGNVKVARVPNATGSLMGVCCVRGELLAVFDLAMCLERPTGERFTDQRTVNQRPTSWIVRASRTNAAFAFEHCEGLVAGAIQVTASGVRLVAVEGDIIPLLPLGTLVASAREATAAGVSSKETGR